MVFFFVFENTPVSDIVADLKYPSNRGKLNLTPFIFIRVKRLVDAYTASKNDAPIR